MSYSMEQYLYDVLLSFLLLTVSAFTPVAVKGLSINDGVGVKMGVNMVQFGDMSTVSL